MFANTFSIDLKTKSHIWHHLTDIINLLFRRLSADVIDGQVASRGQAVRKSSGFIQEEGRLAVRVVDSIDGSVPPPAWTAALEVPRLPSKTKAQPSRYMTMRRLPTVRSKARSAADLSPLSAG